MVPPTPYINQAAIDQHTGNPAPLLPHVNPVTTVQHRQYQVPSNTQTSTLAPPATSVMQAQTGCCPQAIPELQSPMDTIPQDTLPTHLPFVPAPSAPNSTLPTLSPRAPLQTDAQSKSQNGQGVKQAYAGKQASDKVEPICWRCKQTSHLKQACPMPPYCSKCRQEGHILAKCPQMDKRTSVPQSPAGQPQAPMDPRFSNPNNKCLCCSGDHRSAVCPTRSQHQPTPSTSSYVSSAGKPHSNMSPQQSTKNSQATACSTMPALLVNNPAQAPRHDTGNNIPQVTPQVNPNVPQQHNLYMPNVIPPVQMPNQFPPPPYFPIPFPLPPVTPSNVSAASSAPASDLSAAITLMTNAVNQGNSNTTAITDALQRTTTQFADALQQTIQMGVDAQAEEIKNARLDKQFDKIKIFDGSDPSACHSWLEEVHALCTQMGRSFREMLLLCTGQALRAFITDMSPDATDDQIKNDLITGYSDLQGLGCKQAAYDNIVQKPDEPLRSYIVRYSRLFKLLNGTAPNDIKMRTTSMHFINSLRSYLSSKVENRLLSMNERNYSLGDTFKVTLECELKAIASERQHNKCNTAITNQVEVIQPQTPLQPKEINEVHIRNPNYKGKNYDPNFQAKCAEAAHTASYNSKQPQQSSTTGSQYKPTYIKLAPTYNNSNSNAPLTSSSDIVGIVTLKTSVDGYQLLKVNEMIKNAVAWRARMPKTSKFSKYLDNKSKEGTLGMPEPKVHINEAMLEVIGQAAKDFGYTEQEFVEAVEMYQYFGNQNLEDVPIPNTQD